MFIADKHNKDNRDKQKACFVETTHDWRSIRSCTLAHWEENKQNLRMLKGYFIQTDNSTN